MYPSFQQTTATIALVILLVLESLIPFYAHLAAPRLRFRHDARNFTWGILNVLLGAVFIATLLTNVDRWATTSSVGLLRVIDLPAPAEWILAFLLFDLWMYVWHWLNHRIHFLWRFHRMHHSEREMDVSTGVRFHTGEIVLSGLARLVVLPLLGISLSQLVAYEAVLLPVILFHHSNVRLPRWLDYGLAWVIVSPAVHRVHHSHLVEETNSNYGSVFPWWDWLCRTLRMRNDVEDIELGLDEFQGAASNTLAGMATTPFVNVVPTTGNKTGR